ncbi:hypothetical protein GUITHDRAFT_119396 [Guillardia theta CCMP2712]|uniref:Uncharacterized protein n=1 Tax=Guillardia theta (strain CCMP2712) TaxID=905079 RepID=L1IER2_GUITC|nr:hypothetical protein GUITHDRAFT_119396 [Guillardia theta CCMP2712]EKX34394.1 hypothetical protein GUITHDRAFT_119396 [Guillardia theta CCMP2712]|eukprot:XP_005821374.1 hypothetical protein GUITHDRAFT_119396 [Guillardia theta CCMP2712]
MYSESIVSYSLAPQLASSSYHYLKAFAGFSSNKLDSTRRFLASLPCGDNILKSSTTNSTSTTPWRRTSQNVAAAAGGALGGAMLATAAAVAGVQAIGFTSTGIAAGSTAASMMSASAVASGGGVASMASGGVVAALQSIGATGMLGLSARAALASASAIACSSATYGSYRTGRYAYTWYSERRARLKNQQPDKDPISQ